MRYVQGDHESALRIDLTFANIERDRDALAFGIDRERYGHGKRAWRTPRLRHAVGSCSDDSGEDERQADRGSCTNIRRSLSLVVLS
jgi:hypothetical protein